MSRAVNLNLRIAVVVDDAERHALSLFLALRIGLAHETLDRVNCIFRICDGLTLCGVTNFPFSVLYEAHNRRSCTLAFAVGDYHWLVALENGNTAVCST